MLLVSGSTRSVGALADGWPDHLGHLVTPKNRNSIESLLSTGLSWAVDNGAFSGFDPESFRRLLGRVRGRPRLLWVACPDVVGDCHGTLASFEQWQGEVAEAGPVAFVAQNGQERLSLPWDRFDCLFIGGSKECAGCRFVRPKESRDDHCPHCGRELTEWKLSNAAWDLGQEAKRRRKWLHLGRVNSRRRLRYAWSMNADSTDGSSASMFGDKYIHKYLKWQAEMLSWR
jgi:hypothetical protein